MAFQKKILLYRRFRQQIRGGGTMGRPARAFPHAHI
jgi:hypothetical protein